MTNPKSPLCPDSLVTLEVEITGERLSAAWKSQLGIEIPHRFSRQPSFQSWRCTRSQLRFITPAMPGNGDFYAKLRAFDWYYHSEKWEYNSASRRVQRGQRLLDVGCGDGAFIEMMSAKGVISEGLELNPTSVACAHSKGLSVWARLTHEHVMEPGFMPYDVVSTFQVLEHVDAPLAFLRSLVTLVKPGGTLMIGVPNCDGWAGATGGVLQWPPHHLTWWGSASLVYLQQLLPLRLISLEQEPLRVAHRRDRISALLFPSLVPKPTTCGLLDRIGRRLACDITSRLTPVDAMGHTLLAVYERLDAKSP
jgi:2-polyprenyl-3-methyl-5-hydroxy-6-metoxy-1,4-benzoquinol methylase